MSTLKPQIYFSWKQREDIATFVPFEDDTLLLSSASAKFSPFSGKELTCASEATLPVPWEDMSNLVNIGKCTHCNSFHSADVSSVTGLIEKSCQAFWCVDCGSPVDINIDMQQYLEAASAEEADATVISDAIKPEDEKPADATPATLTATAETPTTPSDTASDDVITDENFDDIVARLVDEATENGEITLEDVAGEDDAPPEANSGDGGEGGDDPIVIDDTSDPEATGDVKPVEDPDDAPPPPDTPPVDKPSETKDATPAVEKPPEEPPVKHHRHTEKPVEDKKPEEDTPIDKPADEAALFTQKDNNPEGKTFAEIIEGAPDEKKDTAAVILVNPVKDLDQADIACTLNSTRSKYYVFVDDVPAGTLSRELCHADNAKLFDDQVFVKGFVQQLRNNMNVKRFGYRPYAVRVDTAGIVEKFTEKHREDVAADFSAQFNTRLEVLKKCLGTAATACNKGVWSDFTNPVREAIVARLESLGIEDAAYVVNKAFVEKSSVFVDNLLTKALELSAKSDIARDEITRMVETANYVAPASNDLAAKLAVFGESVTQEAPRVKPNTVITGDNSRDTASANFSWRNAF